VSAVLDGVLWQALMMLFYLPALCAMLHTRLQGEEATMRRLVVECWRIFVCVAVASATHVCAGCGRGFAVGVWTRKRPPLCSAVAKNWDCIMFTNSLIKSARHVLGVGEGTPPE
jgi:hypothetical protein